MPGVADRIRFGTLYRPPARTSGMDPDPDPSRFRDLMLDAEPGFEEVLRCVFDIQAHEARLYLVLLDAPDSTVAELAERVDRDRSNVNRGLSTLREKGLADRQRRPRLPVPGDPARGGPRVDARDARGVGGLRPRTHR